jgi:hypothetical protein
MRLEELDELLGPVVIPERELVDYWWKYLKLRYKVSKNWWSFDLFDL